MNNVEPLFDDAISGLSTADQNAIWLLKETMPTNVTKNLVDAKEYIERARQAMEDAHREWKKRVA